MTRWKRTWEIESIDWRKIFSLYEQQYDCRIDGAIPQDWFDEHVDMIVRRLGACMVYYSKGGYNNGAHSEVVYRDEILSALGIYLGFEEDHDGDEDKES